MRIASFNVENLFDRAKALNPRDWDEGRPVLEAHARLNVLFEEPIYSKAVKDEIVELLTAVHLSDSDEGPLMRLRQNKGRLLKRSRVGGVEVVADGRSDWIGWVDISCR